MFNCIYRIVMSSDYIHFFLFLLYVYIFCISTLIKIFKKSHCILKLTFPLIMTLNAIDSTKLLCFWSFIYVLTRLPEAISIIFGSPKIQCIRKNCSPKIQCVSKKHPFEFRTKNTIINYYIFWIKGYFHLF